MASEIQVIGDWNDVEASLYAVLGKEELAILNADKGIAEQKFEMLRVTDETAWLIARRNPADGDNMIPIRLTAWVGYFGNVERQDRLLQGVAQRLHDLAGVDYRPIAR
jgi:hypothetical protein